MKPLLRTSVLLLLLFFVIPAFASPPLDILEPKVRTVVQILKNPPANVPDPAKVQQDEIWKIVYEIFDFTELSKRSLGKNWRIFSTDQKKEFIIAFSDLLGSTYLNKINGNFKDEDVRFLGQEAIDDNKTMIRSEIIRKSGEPIPMDYKMMSKNDTWRIYDIQVEGISLIKNYRTQFDQFLFKNSPDALIDKIRDNTRKIKAGEVIE